MSVTITVSEETYQKLKNVAESRGFEKVEDFLGEWEKLERANRRKVVNDIVAFRQKMKKKYGVMPDSAELIREDRMR